jgi:hypothetical protein
MYWWTSYTIHALLPLSFYLATKHSWSTIDTLSYCCWLPGLQILLLRMVTNLCGQCIEMFTAKFLIIKPTRCTNFSNLFLKWKFTCFGQFLCPSSHVFHCTHSNGMSYRFADSLRARSGWNCGSILILLVSCQQTSMIYVNHWLCVQWKTPDDGQRNCPKHIEFHSKNKFEKLVHLVGFIIRNLSRCTVTWTSSSLQNQVLHIYTNAYTLNG